MVGGLFGVVGLLVLGAVGLAVMTQVTRGPSSRRRVYVLDQPGRQGGAGELLPVVLVVLILIGAAQVLGIRF